METTLPLLAPLALFILYASLKTTVLVALILLVQRWFNHILTAHGRHLLWLPVIISLVMPFGFDALQLDASSYLTAADSYGSPAAMTGSLNVRAQPNTSVLLNETVDLASKTNPVLPARKDPGDASLYEGSWLSWLWVLPYIWLAGVLGICITVAVSSYKFSRFLRQGELAPHYLQAILQECLIGTRCKRKVKLLLAENLQSPLIAGVFTPVLLWPKGLQLQLTNAQVRHVFIHELMHLQRLDILSNYVATFLQGLHWFNPAIWYAFACMRHDRELACDAATIKHLVGADRRAYPHTLLQLGATLPGTVVPGFALGILDSHSQLHRRILMLVRSSQSHKLQLTISALLLIPLTVLAFGQPVTTSSQPSPLKEAVIEPSPEFKVANITEQNALVATAEQPTQIADSPVIQPTAKQPTIQKLTAQPAAKDTKHISTKTEPRQKSPVAPMKAQSPARLNAAPELKANNLVAMTATANLIAASSAQLQANVSGSQPETERTNKTVCRNLTTPGQNTKQLVCDTAAQWAEFDRHMATPTTTPAVLASIPTQAETEVCRSEKLPGSYIIRKICKSAAQWAVIDSSLQNKTAELHRRLNENSLNPNIYTYGPGPSPAMNESTSDAIANNWSSPQ